MDNERRYAILIDADNVSDKYIKIILDEVANAGIITYKRIYGDWTSSRMASWKKILLENSIIPIQQFSYTVGKNSTDAALIIDAMDILYSETVDGFCLVSSDSDFTKLAARLRESGMEVIGMGEAKTPKPFISACNQFKYLDRLYLAQQKAEREERARLEKENKARKAKEQAEKNQTDRNAHKKNAAKKKNSHGSTNHSVPTTKSQEQDQGKDMENVAAAAALVSESEYEAESSEGRMTAGVTITEISGEGQSMAGTPETENTALDNPELTGASETEDASADVWDVTPVRSTVNAILNQFSDEDGWVSTGKLGDQLSKRMPEFDVRNYGFSKLTSFIRSLGDYEVKRLSIDGGPRQIYLRQKERDTEEE